MASQRASDGRREPHRRWFDSLPSTQSYAVDWIRQGLASDARIVANSQTDGRGRAGHSWTSPLGGLYQSSVLFGHSASDPLESIVVATSIAEFLNAKYRTPLRVKWPNDLVTENSGGGSRKFGGIIVDATAGPGGPAIVVGVGINVDSSIQSFPEAIRGRVGILSDLIGRPVKPSELEEAVDGVVRAAVGFLRYSQSRTSALEQSRQLLYGVGRSAWLDGVPVGTIRGLGESGELLVERSGGSHVVWAGDLVVEGDEGSTNRP